MKIAEAINKIGELVVIKKWEPIGSVKMFDREQDMSKLYYGTWELTLLERSPIGVNPNSTESRFQTAGQQFGNKSEILTLNQLPNFQLDIKDDAGSMPVVNSAYPSVTGWGAFNQGSASASGSPLRVFNKGGNQPHNNIHPVETIYFYKRTA